MGVNKVNWVFLETKKPNLISSVTSLLNSQISAERKIKLFSTVSNENYDNPNISYEKLGNLSFMYPSNSAPKNSEDFIEFQNIYYDKFGKYPDKIAINSYDLIKDLLFRISVSKSLKNPWRLERLNRYKITSITSLRERMGLKMFLFLF